MHLSRGSDTLFQRTIFVSLRITTELTSNLWMEIKTNSRFNSGCPISTGRENTASVSTFSIHSSCSPVATALQRHSKSTNHFITVEFLPFIKDGPFLRISGESDSRKDVNYVIYFRFVDYKDRNGPPADIKHFIDFLRNLPEKRLELTISQKVFFGLWNKKVHLKIELVNDSNSFFIEATYL